MLKKKTTKKDPDIDQAAALVERSDIFLKWRMEIGKKKIETASLAVRMEHMLAGLMMGITELTLLPLCGLTAADTQKWIDAHPENLQEFRKASKYADAQLEFIVQQASLTDSRLAIRVLEKRDPDRWKKSNFDSFKKGIEKGITMGGALGREKSVSKDKFDMSL